MKYSIAIKIIITSFCAFMLMGPANFFVNVQAYNEQVNTVTNSYDAWFHCKNWWNPKPLGTGYVSVTHRIGMTMGSENVEVCDPINFEYIPDDPFFVNNEDGVWDTPYGIWRSTIGVDMNRRDVENGQLVKSKYCGIHTPSTAGYINWSAVKPSVQLISDDESIVTCAGMDCEAVGEGVATITAQVDDVQARMWGYMYFEEAWYGAGAFVKHNINQCELITVHGMTSEVSTNGFGCRSVGDDYAFVEDDAILELPAPSTLMSWIITVAPDSSGVCTPYDGRCNSITNKKTHTQPPTQNLCCDPTVTDSCVTSDGYAQPVPVIDNGNNTYSWSCFGTYGGEVDKCSTLNCAECGDSNGVNTDTKPTLNLCEVGSNLIEPPSVYMQINGGSKGNWEWICENTSAEQSCQSVDCFAPSCLSENPLSINPSMIYEGEGTETVDVTTDCLCCTLGDPYNIEICTGDDPYSIEIPKDSSQTEINAMCSNVPYSTTVNTMCMSRECNAQGTCQSTPKSVQQGGCSSTCNSNADCSSGRIIETRP